MTYSFISSTGIFSQSVVLVSGSVGTTFSFSYNAFQSIFFCYFKKLFAFFINAVTVANDAVFGNQPFQNFPSSPKWFMHQINSIRPEHIKYMIEQFALPCAGPVLKRIELGFTLLIQNHYLAVNNHINAPLLQCLHNRRIIFIKRKI